MPIPLPPTPPDRPALLLDTSPFGVSGLVVRADGELDLETSPGLRAVVLDALERFGRVVVDLHPVGFMDSTGVVLLLEAAAAARRRGATLVVDPSRAVRRVLALVGAEAAVGLRAHVGA